MRHRSSPFQLLGTLIFLAVSSGLISGCQQSLRSELLEIQEIGPDRIAPGRRLELRGTGFPVGRTPRVRFRGTLHRPGRAERTVRYELQGEVVSPERVEVTMTQRALREIGGRGTFRGRVEISFGIAEASHAVGEVMGRRDDVVFDLVPSQTELIRRMPRTLSSLGVVGFETEDGAIRVQAVQLGSEGARAGVRVGDEVVSIGGARVLSLGELVVFDETPETVVELRRPGSLESFELSLRLGGEEPVDLRSIIAFQVAVLVLLGVWLMWGPGARLVAQLVPRGRPSPRRILVLGAAALVGLAFGRLELQLDVLVLGIGAARAVGAAVERTWLARSEGVVRALLSTLAAGAALGVAPDESWDSGLGYGMAIAGLLASAVCGPRRTGAWADEPNMVLYAWIALSLSPPEWTGDTRVVVLSMAALTWLFATIRDWGSAHVWLPSSAAVCAFIGAVLLAWLGPDVEVPSALRVAIGQTLLALLGLLGLRVAVSVFAGAPMRAPLQPLL